MTTHVTSFVISAAAVAAYIAAAAAAMPAQPKPKSQT
jgi:hypothetical protein